MGTMINSPQEERTCSGYLICENNTGISPTKAISPSVNRVEGSPSEHGILRRPKVRISLKIFSSVDAFVVTGHRTLAGIAAGEADSESQPNYA